MKSLRESVKDVGIEPMRGRLPENAMSASEAEMLKYAERDETYTADMSGKARRRKRSVQAKGEKEILPPVMRPSSKGVTMDGQLPPPEGVDLTGLRQVDSHK